MPEGLWQRGVTPYQRSGAASQSAKRRRRSKGGEELRHVGGQGRWPRGAPRCRRPGAAPGRSYPVRGQGRCLGQAAPYPRRVAALPPEGQRSDSTFKAGRGGGAQIRVVQVRSSGCALLEEP